MRQRSSSLSAPQTTPFITQTSSFPQPLAVGEAPASSMGTTEQTSLSELKSLDKPYDYFGDNHGVAM